MCCPWVFLYCIEKKNTLIDNTGCAGGGVASGVDGLVRCERPAVQVLQVGFHDGANNAYNTSEITRQDSGGARRSAFCEGRRKARLGFRHRNRTMCCLHCAGTVRSLRVFERATGILSRYVSTTLPQSVFSLGCTRTSVPGTRVAGEAKNALATRHGRIAYWQPAIPHMGIQGRGIRRLHGCTSEGARRQTFRRGGEPRGAFAACHSGATASVALARSKKRRSAAGNMHAHDTSAPAKTEQNTPTQISKRQQSLNIN